METIQQKNASSLRGTIAAFATYGMWGFFPLYWKQLSAVESMQILAHRIGWAALFCVILMGASGRLGEIVALVRDKKRFPLVALCAALVTANWWIYIWSVNSGRTIEAALGYYINPLLSVVLGALAFGEKVDKWTKTAVLIASAGIIGAAIAYGSVPWSSILLASSFALYGAFKKRLGIDPLLGLSLETLIVAPLAIGFLIFRHVTGAGALGSLGTLPTFLLVFSGVATAVPLLCFAFAANSISLQKLGFIQYVSPTLQLFLGIVVFGEKPSAALFVAFAGVIAAVFIYIFSRKRESAV